MTAEATRVSQTPRHTHPPRKWRNYLLEPRFQLKYTAMVVGVTVVVATVLGYHAYQYSKGQTEMFTIKQVENEVGKGGAPDQQFIEDLQDYAETADRAVLLAIFGGIGVLALALAITGIVVTHRLVGPAYKLKMLIRRVGDGHIKVEGGLRKHDELHDVFDSFQRMVNNMRTERQRDIGELDTAIETATKAGAADLAASLRAMRDRLQKSID
jgi:nitrogen fixation/metabolism regulation signal transduction histidine kinase